MTGEPDVEHYTYVHIENESKFEMTGKVHYASFWFFRCGDDNFKIMPHSSWTATSKGVCLVTRISAYTTNHNDYALDHEVCSYESSGTAYSQFAITHDGSCAYNIVSL